MILGGKMTNPGELRTRISLLKREIVVNPGGFQRPGAQLTPIGSVWAKWTNAHGAEAWSAAAVQAEQPATVLIRYRPDVDTTCLVRKGADLYEIVSLDNIQERGEYLEIKVRRTVEG